MKMCWQHKVFDYNNSKQSMFLFDEKPNVFSSERQTDTHFKWMDIAREIDMLDRCDDE